MKKKISLLLAICLVLTLNITALAERPVKLYVGGEKLVTDVDPKIVNGRTMLPLRSVFEAIDAQVSWDDATQTVTATKDGTMVKLTIGSNIMTVNNVEKELDVAAYIENGRTMIPVRACAEAFNLTVDWNDATHSVRVRKEVQVVSEKFDENGELASKYLYDNNGNLIYHEDFYDGESFSNQKYTYDENDNLILCENSLGLHKGDEGGSWEKYTYDARGNCILYEASDGIKVYYTYDENDRLILTEMPVFGSQTKYTYTSMPENNHKIVIEEFFEDGVVTQKTTSVYSPYLSEVHCEEYGRWYTDFYDEKGNRTQHINSDGKNIQYGATVSTFDQSGNMVREENLNSGYWANYEYDERGNLIRKETSEMFLEKYTYDENNRLVSAEDQYGYISKYITVVR